MTHHYDLLIVGNDPIAIEAAFTACDANLHVAVAMTDGTGVLGCTEQLCDALAILVPELAVSRICGTGLFAPGQSFSMNDLRRELQQVIDDQRQIAIEQLNLRGIDTLFGKSQFVDPHTLRVNNRSFSADQFVIATGTRPGATMLTDGESISNSIQLLQQSTIPSSLAVVGGNRIGMQLGLLFAGVGSAVKIIDGRPLVHCGSETDVLLDRALELGVEFRLGSDLLNAEVFYDDGLSVVDLHLGSGDHIAVERAILANPSLGITDGLNLAAAGIESDENECLWCNDELQTWQSHIRAIGNVVGFPNHVQPETCLGILSDSFNLRREVPRPLGLLRRLTRERVSQRNQGI